MFAKCDQSLSQGDSHRVIVTDVFTVSAAVISESSEMYPSGSPIYVSAWGVEIPFYEIGRIRT